MVLTQAHVHLDMNEINWNKIGMNFFKVWSIAAP